MCLFTQWSSLQCYLYAVSHPSDCISTQNLPQLAFCCCDKHPGQTQLSQGCPFLDNSHHHRKPRQERGAETSEEHCCFPSTFLYSPSATTHGEPVLPTSIIVSYVSPTDIPQFLRGGSLFPGSTWHSRLAIQIMSPSSFPLSNKELNGGGGKNCY